MVTKQDLDELLEDLEGECQGDYCEHKNGNLGAVLFIEAEYVGWKNEGNCRACGEPVREYAMFNRKGHNTIQELRDALGGG